MQELHIDIRHTDLEEISLLMHAGLNPETADMMVYQFEDREPRYTLGFYRKTFEYYPEYYKPCWSDERLRSIIDELNLQSLHYGNTGQMPEERLVPTVIAGVTMLKLQYMSATSTSDCKDIVKKITKF